MRKLVLPLVMLIILINLSLAADLNVEVLDSSPVVIVEKANNATFDLRISSNEDVMDDYRIYSLAGVTISPKDFFQIDAGDTIDMDITVTPQIETLRKFRGFYVFEYQIKGEETSFYTDRLTIEILELKDALEIDPVNIGIEDESAEIVIKNLEDIEINDLTINLESKFFDYSETINIEPSGEARINVPLNKDVMRLNAGEYEVEVVFELNGQTSGTNAVLNYLEEGEISVSTESSGLISRKTTITKTNEGNIPSVAEIQVSKDVLSRLFTSYSQVPMTSERNGAVVHYTWQEELAPGESISITSTTNYTIPFILLILIIGVVVTARYLGRKNLLLQKRVSYVKTKGGEFALKVRIRAKARKTLDELAVTDRLPMMAKLYEKFGAKPDKIDSKTRKLVWEVKRLNKGEERVFTYIIYSKINVVGNFELPSASASYKIDGKHEYVNSNKTSLSTQTADSDEKKPTI